MYGDRDNHDWSVFLASDLRELKRTVVLEGVILRRVCWRRSRPLAKEQSVQWTTCRHHLATDTGEQRG